jgi:hypothetical protein
MNRRLLEPLLILALSLCFAIEKAGAESPSGAASPIGQARVYLLSALPTDQEDPVDLAPFIQTIESEIGSLIAIGDSMVPHQINKLTWIVIRNELTDHQAEFQSYLKLTPASLLGMFRLQPHRLHVVKDLFVSLRKFWKATHPHDEDLQREGLPSQKSTCPTSECQDLENRLRKLLPKLQKLHRLNLNYFLNGMHRKYVGRPNEPEGSLLQKARRHLESLGENFEVVIVREARARDLAAALARPETVGLIWIGHSMSNDRTIVADKIADAEGNDVQSIFSLVTSNLRYLGVVGCQAKPILDRFRSKGAFAHAEHLVISSYEDRVEIENKTMNAVYELMARMSQEFKGSLPFPWHGASARFAFPGSQYSPQRVFCPKTPQEGLQLVVRRMAPETKAIDLQLEALGSMIAYLPANSPLQQRDANSTIRLPLKATDKFEDLVIAVSGSNPDRTSAGPVQLPELEIRTVDNSVVWKLKRLPNGRPLGFSKQVYEPVGHIRGLEKLAGPSCAKVQ